MTKEDAKNKLSDLVALSTTDTEAKHISADKILCELLWSLDCKEVVEEYQKLKRWYS